MTHYFYATSDAAAVQVVRDFEGVQDAFRAGCAAMAEVFGGAGSTMYSGSRNYCGGVKIGAGRELDVHWRRPDQYGYRALRSSAVPAKGSTKVQRLEAKLEHERLLALWAEHAPVEFDKDHTWEALGVDRGSIWLCGGVCFVLEGRAYFVLGFQVNQDDGSGGKIAGAEEILASDYEQARKLKVQAK